MPCCTATDGAMGKIPTTSLVSEPSDEPEVFAWSVEPDPDGDPEPQPTSASERTEAPASNVDQRLFMFFPLKPVDSAPSGEPKLL